MKKALALVLALTLSLSLVACGGGASSSAAGSTASGTTSGSATAEPAGAGLYPGTADPEGITVNLASEPPEMNPLTTTDSTSMNVLRHIYQGMMYLDAEDNAVPGVAESYEVSEDGLTYTFKLKEGLTWSNGEPVTSADFVFGLRTFFSAGDGGRLPVHLGHADPGRRGRVSRARPPWRRSASRRRTSTRWCIT